MSLVNRLNAITEYGEDLNLLKQYTDVLELTDGTGESRIVITPVFQGKVMTSTFDGMKGISNGWINRDQMKKDKVHNGGEYGGEDRLWIGPLGGQMSFYYQQIKPLSDQNWLPPAPLTTGGYKVASRRDNQINMETDLHLVNWLGTEFNLHVVRSIRLMNKTEMRKHLGVELTGLKAVGYESSHQLTNSGTVQWKKETGLCGLWSLGMYPGTEMGIGIIPMGKGTTRNTVDETLTNLGKDQWDVADGVVYYRVDGRKWNKIGIPASHCGKTFGSYHPETSVLTLVQYRFDPEADLYFNSTVSMQQNPYDGQPVQLYNNGPQDKPVADEASFYELESTSAMKELKPGEQLHHWHRVYHMKGDSATIDQVMRATLGVGLEEVRLF